MSIALGSRDFYFGGLRNKEDDADSSMLTLLVINEEAFSISVTVEQLQGHFVTRNISALTGVEILLPTEIRVTNSSYSQRHKGIRIQSTGNIVVTALSSKQNSSDAFKIYPMLSPHPQIFVEYVYYAMATGSSSGTESPYWSQILLIGSRDNTTIRISPSQSIKIPQNLQDTGNNYVTIDMGGLYTGILHEKQSFLFGVAGGDLTGTKIISDKPLAVFSGHECADFGQGSCSFMAEQIPPIGYWGREFILSPYIANEYIVLASVSNTMLNRTCTNGFRNTTTLSHEGNWYQFSNLAFCSLIADVPVLVSAITTGDHPLMTLVTPIEQYESNVSFKPYSCATNNSIVLAAYTQFIDTANILFNGNPLHDNGTTFFPGVGYTFHIVLRDMSRQVINSEFGVGVSFYGESEVCWYAYTPVWRLTPLSGKLSRSHQIILKFTL